MTERIDLRKERRLLERVSLTFDFFRENFGVLGKALLLVAGPVLALAAVFVSFTAEAPKISHILDDSVSAVTLSQYSASTIFPILIGASVVCTLVYSFLILYDEQQEPVSFEQLLKKSRSLWPRILLTMLLLTAVLIPFAVLSIFMLMLPFIWVILPLQIGFFASLREKSGITGLFKRGFELVSNHWSDTFGLSICVYFVVNSLASVFSLPSAAYAYYLTVMIPEQETPFESNIIFQILQSVNILASQLIYSFAFTAIALQYYYLCEKKENTGLFRKIAAVGQDLKNPAVHEQTGRANEDFSF